MNEIKTPIKINFSDFWAHNSDFYETWWVYKVLKKHFTFEISDKPDILFFSVHGQKHFSYNCHKVQYIDEPVHPTFWCADFAFSFDYLNNPRHLRLPNYVWWFTPDYSLAGLLQPKSEDDVRRLARGKNKFCCFIVSNAGGAERNAFFDKLSTYKKVDSAGRYRNNIGYELGHQMADKFAFAQEYKFSLCFENASMPGYTTEKLINAKQANTIPIYWGNPLVHNEVNPKSFINYNDYGSFDKLLERVIEVDNNEDLYFQYLKEPIFYNGVPNEYFDEDRIVTFFKEVIRAAGITTPVSKKLPFIAYKIKFSASQSKVWSFSRSLYQKLSKH